VTTDLFDDLVAMLPTVSIYMQEVTEFVKSRGEILLIRHGRGHNSSRLVAR
jgi:hypothetical protein